jgi:hypothetical protein
MMLKIGMVLLAIGSVALSLAVPAAAWASAANGPATTAGPRTSPGPGVATPVETSFWLATATGDVLSFGGTRPYGSVSGPLKQPVVGISPTRDQDGYWLVASDGGIFSYGDATFYGSAGTLRLNKPVVGMAPAKADKGYWLVASDGGIFSYGDAKFYGSTGALRLNLNPPMKVEIR